MKLTITIVLERGEDLREGQGDPELREHEPGALGPLQLLCVCTYIYIYIYKERERERCMCVLYKYIYIYICIHMFTHTQ